VRSGKVPQLKRGGKGGRWKKGNCSLKDSRGRGGKKESLLGKKKNRLKAGVTSESRSAGDLKEPGGLPRKKKIESTKGKNGAKL